MLPKAKVRLSHETSRHAHERLGGMMAQCVSIGRQLSGCRTHGLFWGEMDATADVPREPAPGLTRLPAGITCGVVPLLRCLNAFGNGLVPPQQHLDSRAEVSKRVGRQESVIKYSSLFRCQLGPRGWWEEHVMTLGRYSLRLTETTGQQLESGLWAIGA